MIKRVTCWMILRLLCPAARSSRLTIFLILVCISLTSLNCTSACRRARVISLRHSFNTFSSMIVALLICCMAREILPPNWAKTIFATEYCKIPKQLYRDFEQTKIYGDAEGGEGENLILRGNQKLWIESGEVLYCESENNSILLQNP